MVNFDLVRQAGRDGTLLAVRPAFAPHGEHRAKRLSASARSYHDHTTHTTSPGPRAGRVTVTPPGPAATWWPAGPAPNCYCEEVEPTMATSPDCPHEAANIVAVLIAAGRSTGTEHGVPRAVRRLLGPPPGDSGEILGWSQLADAEEPRSTALGPPSSACAAGDEENWPAEHGPAWSTRWMPLLRDGSAR